MKAILKFIDEDKEVIIGYIDFKTLVVLIIKF
jgi:hypothetical protein